jgi:hypothetical protein
VVDVSPTIGKVTFLNCTVMSTTRRAKSRGFIASCWSRAPSSPVTAPAAARLADAIAPVGHRGAVERQFELEKLIAAEVLLCRPDANEFGRIAFAQRLTCTIADACQVTGLGRTTIYQQIAEGRVKRTLSGSASEASEDQFLRQAGTSRASVLVSRHEFSARRCPPGGGR